MQKKYSIAEHELISAVKARDLTQVNQLLKQGVDGSCAINLAVELNSHAILHSITNEKNAFQALAATIKYNKLNMTKSLLKYFDANMQNDKKETMLHVAADYGNIAMLAFFLEQGVDIDSQNYGGQTALHIVIEKGFTEVAEFLLTHNPNTSVKDDEGYTPLHIAANKNNSSMVNILVNAGANIDEQDGQGETALHSVIEQENIPMATCLLLLDANPNISDIYQVYPLHSAILKNEKSLVNLLINNGADCTILYEDEFTLFDVSMGNDNISLCEELLFQILKKNKEFAQSWVKSTKFLERTDELDNDLLTWARYKNHIEVIDLLMAEQRIEYLPLKSILNEEKLFTIIPAVGAPTKSANTGREKNALVFNLPFNENSKHTLGVDNKAVVFEFKEQSEIDNLRDWQEKNWHSFNSELSSTESSASDEVIALNLYHSEKIPSKINPVHPLLKIHAEILTTIVEKTGCKIETIPTRKRFLANLFSWDQSVPKGAEYNKSDVFEKSFHNDEAKKEDAFIFTLLIFVAGKNYRPEHNKALSFPGSNASDHKDIFPDANKIVACLFPSYTHHGTRPWSLNDCPEGKSAATIQNIWKQYKGRKTLLFNGDNERKKQLSNLWQLLGQAKTASDVFKLIDGYSFVLFKDKLKTNNRLQRSILIIDKRLFLYKMFRQQLVNNPIPQNEQILELTNQKIVEMQDYLNHMVAIRLPWRVSYVLRVAATIPGMNSEQVAETIFNSFPQYAVPELMEEEQERASFLL